MKTVKEVSKQVGISVRTLHYYDEIKLLKPSFVSDKGYRYYSDDDLKKIHHIKIFKELGMPLKNIKEVMTNPDFNHSRVLSSQKAMLMLKRRKIDHLINQIESLQNDGAFRFDETEWELVWDEIYQQQGQVQHDVLEPVKNFVKVMKETSSTKVLDLGCGTGRNTLYLLNEGFDVTATDISEKGLKMTERKASQLGYSLSTAKHDIRNIPYDNDTFDAVLCSWVSGHGNKEDMKKHASEMLRVLKPGGLIFVDYPSKEDKYYGRGTQIADDTFIDNVPGEEKIPHYYTDIPELQTLYKEHILTIEPYTYRFIANNEEHAIKAIITVLKKQ